MEYLFFISEIQYDSTSSLTYYWAQNEMYMGGDRKKREKVCRSKGCV